MQRGGPPSFLAAILNRELHGGAIHKRPFVAEFRCEGQCCGTVMNNPGLTGTPAFAAEYSKVYNSCKLLAVADEEGFVSVVDTVAELPTEMADDCSPNKPRAQWLAHRNAVFDIAWCNGDSQMLTASGDQTVALWDTGHADLLSSFRGHSGSVKTVAPMPAANAIFASGARDGALMVWDARVAARPDITTGDTFLSPVIAIQDAHALSEKQKRRRTPLQGRTRPSVTSLAFLQGTGTQLATGGVDGIVKFWDLRQSSSGSTAQAAPALQLARLCDASVPHIGQKQHGITSLALHPHGSQLLVSLMGGHHFVYDTLRPNIGPTRWFGGHTVASFYVKAAWSPDGTHIISGSTDRNAYIWEVDAPDGASPYVLPGHQGEVTAVAWCPTDFHQIATTADDATLKLWHIQRRQPEEQADDGSPRQPWVYPWQQERQVEAAAAAVAALGNAGRGAAIPGCGKGPAGEGSGTPWTARTFVGGPASSGSASMLAVLENEATVMGPGVLMARRGTRDENSHTNLGRPQQLQASTEQQLQQQSTAETALPPQQQQSTAETALPPQQQQQAPGAQEVAPGTAGSTGRLQYYLTPFAGPAANGAAASSPVAGGAPCTGATAGGSGHQMRRIGDLLQAAPSMRRTKQQTSIASFLCSPAAAPTGAAGAEAAAAAAEGHGTTRKRVSLRERGAVAASTTTGTGAGGTSSIKAAGGGSASNRGSPLPLPLPGLGGSALPLADQRAKRMRVSFEPTAAAMPGKLGAAAGPATKQQQQGAGAAAQLEPSPKLAAKEAQQCTSIERQPSSQENVDVLQSS